MNDVPLPVERLRNEGWGENLHERDCYLRHLETFGLKANRIFRKRSVALELVPGQYSCLYERPRRLS